MGRTMNGAQSRHHPGGHAQTSIPIQICLVATGRELPNVTSPRGHSGDNAGVERGGVAAAHKTQVPPTLLTQKSSSYKSIR